MKTSAATLRVLVDNQAHGLCSEHGFAAWVEVAGRRILFDTGQKAALFSNAEKLGIDLRTVDRLVLSHGHYDHTGGVPEVLENAPGVRVYLHPAALDKRFAVREGVAKLIAMPEAAKAALDDFSTKENGIHWITNPVELVAGVGLSGPITRLTEYEDTGGPFFLNPEGTISDPIADDLALWLRSDRGLVVVVGCSHAGLINTLLHALQITGETRLHAVIGGFHLNAASQTRLQRTIDALSDLAPELIVPCHCTGELAAEMLITTFGERVVHGFAGASFSFSRKRP